MSQNPNEQSQKLEIKSDENRESQILKANKEDNQISKNFSLSTWQSEMLRFISWFSSKFSQLSQINLTEETVSNVELLNSKQSFSENRENLYGALIFLKKNIELLHYISQNITYIEEDNLSDFVTILDLFKKISDMIYSDREYYQDLLNAFPKIDNYSFCPSCNILEESIDYMLCETCDTYLIKGDEIRRYFADHFFKKIIKLPPNLANKLYFQFTGTIEEIEYLKKGKIHKKKIIVVPGDSVLGTNKKYQFFTVSDNSKLILEDNMPKVLTTINKKFDELIERQKDITFTKDLLSEADKNQIKKLLCRNCGSVMKLHRTTTYYDTNCDLYSCPKCRMKAMINFQPIWEGRNEE